MRAARRDLRLQDCGLFAAESPKYLAARLSTPRAKFSASELQAFATGKDNFNLFQAKNKDGSRRKIEEPKPRLQRIHKRVHELLSRVAVPAYMHSAVRGRSYLTNAGAHDPNVRAIKIDIKKFFRSVPRAKVFHFFHDHLNCRSDVAGLMAALLTFENHLPTGGSASPIIAYYAFKPMFDAIAELAKKHGLHMTCYVDDMTLSGEAATGMLLLKVRLLIAEYGLKSHKACLFTPGQPRVVTGVCLTNNGKKVPNKLHLKIKNGFESLNIARTVQEKAKIRRSLIGRLEAAGQIDPLFKARASTLRAVKFE